MRPLSKKLSSSEISRLNEKSIFDLLKEIKKRPGMYVLNNNYEQQYRELQVLIVGYELALETHKISEPGRDFMKRFGIFLNNKYGWSMSCGPLAAIEVECQCSEKAWFRFWELLELYRSSFDDNAKT